MLGFGLVVYARQSRPAADASAPQIDDHWHHRYGFYLCDTWFELRATPRSRRDGQLINTEFARTGIHSHDDGLIHWHAFTSAAVGRNATLGVFLDVYNVELTNEQAHLPRGAAAVPAVRAGDRRLRGGRDHLRHRRRGEDGSLKVVVWDNFSDTDDGTTFIADFNNIRLDRTAMVVAIAFVPNDTDVGLPPSAPELPSSARPTPTSLRPRRPARRAPPVPDPGEAAGLDRLMRAVVLVGGFGTRLRPLTASIPKPMLPVGHRPMIARLIDRLARGGVTEVVLALGFRPEPFVEAFPDGRLRESKLSYAVEPEPLDTGGAIRFAAEFAGIDDTFVVANGDVITDLDVSELVAAHRRRSAEATIHLIGVDDPSAFGVVDLGATGSCVASSRSRRRATEPSNLINAGTYVFEPSVLDRIDPAARVSIERDTFPLVAQRRDLRIRHRRLLDRRRPP